MFITFERQRKPFEFQRIGGVNEAFSRVLWREFDQKNRYIAGQFVFIFVTAVLHTFLDTFPKRCCPFLATGTFTFNIGCKEFTLYKIDKTYVVFCTIVLIASFSNNASHASIDYLINFFNTTEASSKLIFTLWYP